MEQSKKERLLQAGVNVDSAMERFMGNEALFLKFLKRVSGEQNYELLKSSMAEGRYEDAFQAAHALKGVFGNLSLDTIFEITSQATEFLRNQKYDEAQELMPKIVDAYEKLIKVIDEI